MQAAAGRPCCVTPWVCPAMVRAAVRASPPPLAATAYPIVPGPEPEPPADTVTQLPFDVVVQVHPAPIESATDPVPPSAPYVAVAGDSVGVQDGVGSVGEWLPQAQIRTDVVIRTAAIVRCDM